MSEEVILSLEQEQFCKNYTQNSEFFGNATLSYADAYGYDLETADKTRQVDKEGNEIRGTSEHDKMYNTCAVAGSQNIRKHNIQLRCRVLLNEMMKDDVIDARMIEIILKGDDADSLRAISEYNKLKQRIVDKKAIEHSGSVVGIEFIRNDGDNKDTNTSNT